MVDKFGGSVEQALAAYNAGTDRVEEWLGQGKYRDIAEFVESIPFTETREYVQAIVRNANVYRQLYGAPCHVLSHGFTRITRIKFLVKNQGRYSWKTKVKRPPVSFCTISSAGS